MTENTSSQPSTNQDLRLQRALFLQSLGLSKAQRLSLGGRWAAMGGSPASRGSPVTRLPSPPAARYAPHRDLKKLAAAGERHGNAPRCRQPIEVVTRRWFRRDGIARVSERFWCAQHGQEKAERWGITIAPAPKARSSR